MLRRDVLKAGLLTIAGVGLSPLRSSEVRAEAGWIALFDGKTVDNWNSIGTAKWKVEDGAAVADNGNGFLVSKTALHRLSAPGGILGRGQDQQRRLHSLHRSGQR